MVLPLTVLEEEFAELDRYVVLPLAVLEEEFAELDRYVVLPLTVLEELAELDRRLEQV